MISEPGNSLRYVHNYWRAVLPVAKNSRSMLLDGLENNLEKYENQLRELKVVSNELTAKYNEKIEYQECLEKGKAFFEVGAVYTESVIPEPLSNSMGATPAEDGSQPLLGAFGEISVAQLPVHNI